MILPLTYEEALERHPAEVAAVIKQVLKGRSKFRLTDPATWTWRYNWSERVEGGPHDIESMFFKPRPRTNLPLEARVDACLLRCGTHLQGAGGYVEVSSEVLREHLTGVYRERIAEEEAQALKTPEQVAEDVRVALEFLQGPRNREFFSFALPIPVQVDRPQGTDTMLSAFLEDRKK